MNKKELVAAVAEQAGLKKVDAEKAIEAFTAVVEGALKAGDKVQLVGFGTFEVAERPEREGRTKVCKLEPPGTIIKPPYLSPWSSNVIFAAYKISCFPYTTHTTQNME